MNKKWLWHWISNCESKTSMNFKKYSRNFKNSPWYNKYPYISKYSSKQKYVLELQKLFYQFQKKCASIVKFSPIQKMVHGIKKVFRISRNVCEFIKMFVIYKKIATWWNFFTNLINFHMFMSKKMFKILKKRSWFVKICSQNWKMVINEKKRKNLKRKEE